MRLDRNGPDGIGKYAIIDMRRVQNMPPGSYVLHAALDLLKSYGVLQYGEPGTEHEFLTVTNNHEWDIVAKTPVEKPAQSVILPWVTERCSFSQQITLLLALRTCDLAAGHCGRRYVQELRKTILQPVNTTPIKHGDAFANYVIALFLETLDQCSINWITHFMNACAVIGFKHPDPSVAARWNQLYTAILLKLTAKTEVMESVNRLLQEDQPECLMPHMTDEE